MTHEYMYIYSNESIDTLFGITLVHKLGFSLHFMSVYTDGMECSRKCILNITRVSIHWLMMKDEVELSHIKI